MAGEEKEVIKIVKNIIKETFKGNLERILNPKIKKNILLFQILLGNRNIMFHPYLQNYYYQHLPQTLT